MGALPKEPAAAAAPFEVLVDDEALRVSRQSGRSRQTIISFAGVGLGHIGGGGEQREEFGRTLAEAGGAEHTLIYVVDRRRSWMNGIGHRIAGILRDLTGSADSVITLGNSMGGFAALWIAGLLPNCRRAVAMAPQFSVHPDHMPRERRWQEYRSAITTHDVSHAFEHRSDGVGYWVVFGDQNALDNGHAARMRQHGGDGLRLLVVAGSDHDVARDMRRADTLTPLLRMLLRQQPVEDAAVLSMLGKAGLRASLAGPAAPDATPRDDGDLRAR